MVDVAPLPATTPFMFHSVEHTHGSFSFTSLLFSTSSCSPFTNWPSLSHAFHHFVLGCAHHRLWQEKQLCTDFSQRAAASRVETVQLTAAAKRCFGLYSFTHQTSTNALGTPTPLRRDNCQVKKLKKLARMLCPNYSKTVVPEL